jgi:hypothetical protein
MIGTILEARMDIARALARAVHEAVRRTDTDHVAFHGCIDWHSAVHGTWALTAYTRMTGDRRYVPVITGVLSPAKVAAERAFICAHPDFEMPYGRAWFLRLAMEHRAMFGDDLLTPMADDVLASMLAYCGGRALDPRRGSYESDAWALINMLDYARASHNSSAVEMVRHWVSRRFVPCDGDCSYDVEAGHFMAVATNWAWLVSRVLQGEPFDRWAQAFFARVGLPTPVTQPVTWHHHGLNFSRAWGLWGLYEAVGSAEMKDAFLAAYVAHFSATYDRPDHWRGSYQGVGHWVPQFGMFALQPLFGASAGAVA